MKLVVRILAFLIDIILVMIPASLISMLFYGSGIMVILISQALFVIYNIVCLLNNQQTIGKYFSKLKVIVDNKTAMQYGMREIAKLLYFLPLVNIIFLSISAIMYYLSQKTLHDRIGESDVLFLREVKKLKVEDTYYE